MISAALYRVEQAAEILGASQESVLALMQARILRYAQTAKNPNDMRGLRVSAQSLEDYMEGRALTPASSGVYFAQALTGGPIKIGVARSLKKRLSSLQISSPVELVVLGVMEGGVEKERELHRRFARYRTRGEWFKPRRELLNLIRTGCDSYDVWLERERLAALVAQEN